MLLLKATVLSILVFAGVAAILGPLSGKYFLRTKARMMKAGRGKAYLIAYAVVYFGAVALLYYVIQVIAQREVFGDAIGLFEIFIAGSIPPLAILVVFIWVIKVHGVIR